MFVDEDMLVDEKTEAHRACDLFIAIGGLRSHRLVTAWGLEVMEGGSGQ